MDSPCLAATANKFVTSGLASLTWVCLLQIQVDRTLQTQVLLNRQHEMIRWNLRRPPKTLKHQREEKDT